MASIINLCMMKASKNNPHVLTKDQMVEIAMRELKWSVSAARRATKAVICQALVEAGVTADKILNKAIASPQPTETTTSSPTASEAVAVFTPIRGRRSRTPDEDISPVGSSIASSVAGTARRKARKPEIVADESLISETPLEILPHQQRVMQWINRPDVRGLIVADGVGSGKTLSAVSASERFLELHPEGRIVVVAPKTLKANFVKELYAYGKTPSERYSFYTYQKFSKDFNGGEVTMDENVMLIIDEAHNLRTDTYTRQDSGVLSRTMVKAAMLVGKVLLLTGTPIYNSTYDIANLVAMVKGQYPMTKGDFKELLADEGLFRQYFAHTIRFYSREEEKADEYPSYSINDVEVVMTPQYYRKYHEIEKEISDVPDYTGDPWRFLTGLRQAANEIYESPKAIATLRLVQQPGKSVVYSTFINHGLRILEEILQQNEIPYAVLSGENSEAERTKAVEDYNDDRIRVLLISKAGAEGIDLKRTNRVVLFESTWNAPGEEQIIARAVRYRSHDGLDDKDKHVKVYRLIMVKPDRIDADDTERKSADQMLIAIADRKKAEAEEVIERLKQVSIDALQDKDYVPYKYIYGLDRVKLHLSTTRPRGGYPSEILQQVMRKNGISFPYNKIAAVDRLFLLEGRETGPKNKYLAEDPWEREKMIKKMKKTKL